MTATYRSYNPDHPVLFPAHMADCLPEGHLVFFIRDLVSKLDLSRIHAAYKDRRGGQPPYHPAMMMGLLLYGYCTGVTSSRKLEKATWESVPFRVLANDQHPDHDTIAEFRSRHLPVLADLFTQSLILCQKAGLVKLGHVALDGTKVEASASKHKAMSYGRMEKKAEELKAEISELLKKVASDDAAEDALHGKGVRGDELPKELARRESRVAKIEAAMRDLEAEAADREAAAKAEKAAKKIETVEKAAAAGSESGDGGPGFPPPDTAMPEAADGGSGGVEVVVVPPRPEDKAQRNFTDPDARIMQDGATKEFLYACNAQAAVDSHAQVIVATGLTQAANDYGQAVPMLSAAIANAGDASIGKVSMDAGYSSDANIEALEGMGLDVYASPGQVRKTAAKTAPDAGSPVSIGTEMKPRERMRAKLASEAGKAVYRMRKAIVEPVFGQIKGALGFRRFSFRGFGKVSCEWSLVCAVHNLLKLFRNGMTKGNCPPAAAKGVAGRPMPAFLADCA